MTVRYHLDDVSDGHGGHVHHHEADVAVWELLGRLGEEQRPLLREVRHPELDEVPDVDPANFLHCDLP